jgi:2-oxoglutarate/2-oxoacid ferredoxin oxidoreductase subunit beta
MTTSIPKPKVRHPGLPVNQIGLTRRDYEGVMSTLCAGCGHDSITAAIVRAFYELSIPPHRVAKLSGIGCSSKTTAYFLKEAHGFNAVHGRMPSIATGACAANRDLIYIGVSGDGDSLSIGLGQFCHAIRRNLNVLYVLENNGVYGLTKGQFSASADLGSKPKKGEPNRQPPIDPVLLALSLGATFVARSFSGDKDQLVPIIKAGLAHQGFAFIDVISPCVTFNDHEGSTKSYKFTRERKRDVVMADHVVDHDEPAPSDLVPLRTEIAAAYAPGGVIDVTMHDGSTVRLRKVDELYDPTDRDRAYAYVRATQSKGEVVTGLLYLATGTPDMHQLENTVDTPLAWLPYEQLCPGSSALAELMEAFR